MRSCCRDCAGYTSQSKHLSLDSAARVPSRVLSLYCGNCKQEKEMSIIMFKYILLFIEFLAFRDCYILERELFFQI